MWLDKYGRELKLAGLFVLVGYFNIKMNLFTLRLCNEVSY